jgi:DNA primase catalytic subunit
MTAASLQQQLSDVKNQQIVTKIRNELLQKENERLKKRLEQKEKLLKPLLRIKKIKDQEIIREEQERIKKEQERIKQTIKQRIKKIEEEYNFYDLAKLPGQQQQKQSLLAKKQFLKENYQAIENEQPIPNSRFTYSKKQKK